MSAITALFNLDAAPLEPDHLRTITDAALRSGIDNALIWHKDNVGLGQTQPITSTSEPFPLTLDERVFLIADARIDDQQTLVAKLRAAGRDIQAGCSDAALILHAYLVWGCDALQHLMGDFVFILYDTAERRLFAARDQFGVRPLFYAAKNNAVLCSNSLAALRAHPLVSDTLDEAVIADFLVIGYPSDFASSAYADIRRLPPGHMLLAQDGQVKVERYWSLPQVEWRTWREDDAAAAVYHALEQAVQDRLRTPAAVVSMSGGLDSPAIAAVAQRLQDEGHSATRIRAISAGALWLLPDTELYYARLTAEHSGFPIEYVQLEDVLPQFTSDDPHQSWALMPEPVESMSSLIARRINSAVASSEGVMFSGLGGDPLFHSGMHYMTELKANGGWYGLARDLASYHRRKPRRLLRHLLTWRHQPRNVEAAVAAALPVLNPDLARRIHANERYRRVFTDLMTIPELEGMIRKPFWSYFLAAGDPNFHGVSTRILFPFFDLRLLNVALQIPPLPLRMGKHVLRESLRDVLPEAVRTRAKTPLQGSLLREAFQRKQPAWVTDLPQSDALLPFINAEFVEEQSDSPDSALKLMKVFALAYWLQYRK